MGSEAKTKRISSGPAFDAWRKSSPLIDRMVGIAERHRIHISVCDGWPKAGGVFSTDMKRSLIHIDRTMHIVDQTWALAHEIGHHFTRMHLLDRARERAERLADDFATALLANLVAAEELAAHAEGDHHGQ